MRELPIHRVNKGDQAGGAERIFRGLRKGRTPPEPSQHSKHAAQELNRRPLPSWPRAADSPGAI